MEVWLELGYKQSTHNHEEQVYRPELGRPAKILLMFIPPVPHIIIVSRNTHFYNLPCPISFSIWHMSSLYGQRSLIIKHRLGLWCLSDTQDYQHYFSFFNTSSNLPLDHKKRATDTRFTTLFCRPLSSATYYKFIISRTTTT